MYSLPSLHPQILILNGKTQNVIQYFKLNNNKFSQIKTRLTGLKS